jgi:hypothetical protein
VLDWGSRSISGAELPVKSIPGLGRAAAESRGPNVERTVPWLPTAWGWLLYTIGIAALVRMFVLNLSFLLRFKRNIPMADEWGMFNPLRGLDFHLSATWVFATTNAHPMAIERLVHWYTLITTGYDFRIQTLLQLVLLFSVASLVILFLKELGSILPLVMSGLFTALQVPNMFWPHQFFFFVHFILVFWTAYLLARDDAKLNALGYFIGLISIIQSGGALAATLLLIVLGAGFGIQLTGVRRRIHLVGAIALIMGLAAWLLLGTRDNSFDIAAFPWQPTFWTTFGELLANGFGTLSAMGTAIGMSLFVILLAALLYLAAVTRFFRESTFLDRFGVIMSGTGLAIAASIAASRAHAPGTGFEERYHIVGYHLLVGLLFILMAVLQRFSGWSKTAGRVLLTVIFAWSLIWKMDIASVYVEQARRQAANLTCAQNFFRNRSAVKCPSGPFDDDLQVLAVERSRDLGATWCFTVMDLPQIPDRTNQCYAALFSSWKPLQP